MWNHGSGNLHLFVRLSIRPGKLAPFHNMLPFRLRQGYLSKSYLTPLCSNGVSPCGLVCVTSLCASVSLFLKRRIWSICIKDLFVVCSVQSLSHV